MALWQLKHVNGQSKLDLKPNIKYAVGRKDADLVLANDESISRKHAYVSLKYHPESATPFVATVEDIGSLCGTFIQTPIGKWQKLSKGAPHVLNGGDTIKFGQHRHLWQYQCSEMVMTTSNMSPRMRSELKNYVTRLGGRLKKEWSAECTHLAMEKITMTVKVVCALASACPIVTTNYWKSYYENILENRPPPDYREFIPPIMEHTINPADSTFAIMPSRKNVFSGKLFVAASQERLAALTPMIIAAGGTAVSFQSCGLSVEQLTQPHVLVIQHICNPSQEPASFVAFREALKHLSDKGLRAIPESEIGLAVLASSTEKHCNPAFNVQKNLLIPNDDVTASPSTPSRTSVFNITSQVIAYDTQEIVNKVHSTPVQLQQNIVIPDSGSMASSSMHPDSLTLDLLDLDHCNRNLEDDSTKKQNDTRDDLCGENNPNRKRIRGLEEDDQRPLKKLGISTRSIRDDALSANKVTTYEDDADCFEFPESLNSRNLKRKQDTYQDTSFDFPESRSSKSVCVNKGLDADRDLFEPSTSSHGRILNDDEDMFADFESSNNISEANTTPNANRISTVPQETETSAKRICTAGSEEKKPPVRQCAESQSSVSVPALQLGRKTVSLEGFLNTSAIKKEIKSESSLDEPEELVKVEVMALVVRSIPSQSTQIGAVKTTNSSTNFKTFRKVQHPYRTVLPQIIGGSDLSVVPCDLDSKWDRSMSPELTDSDEDGEEEENDMWAFPKHSTSNKVSQSKNGSINNRRK